jgi:hypothetical protein
MQFTFSHRMTAAAGVQSALGVAYQVARPLLLRLP